MEHGQTYSGAEADLLASFIRLSEDRRGRMTLDEIPADYRQVHSAVMEAVHATYGAERAMGFSKAIHPDGFTFFIEVTTWLKRLGRPIRVLEIGSFEGVSLSVIGSLLNQLQIRGELYSIDPYFADGYPEDHPAFGHYQKNSNPLTKDLALALYRRLRLDVSLIQSTSIAGLKRLLNEGKEFDLIYIDGLHNGITPLVDFGMSVALLPEDGVVVLDDWAWPDIVGMKALCDRHLVRIAECPDIAAYSLEKSS